MQKHVRVSEIIDTIPLKYVTEAERTKLYELNYIPKIDAPVTRKDLFQLINSDVLENKSKIGVNVHTAIHKDYEGFMPVLSSEKGLGYFESYEKWAEAYVPEYVWMEQRLYCDKLMLTGQIDALAKFADQDQAMIIDFKTSAKVSLETWTYQAHYYYYLMTQNTFQVAPTMRFINLRRNSTTKKGVKANVVDIPFSSDTMEICVRYAHRYWEDRKMAFDVD